MNRSELMSRIRSKWTTPERVAHGMLKAQHIRHKMHPDLPGHPDVLLKDCNVVVFIHGCFWHGCRRHYREPKTNTTFWRNKIECNKRRHKKNVAILRRMDYIVEVMWEHDLK